MRRRLIGCVLFCWMITALGLPNPTLAADVPSPQPTKTGDEVERFNKAVKELIGTPKVPRSDELIVYAVAAPPSGPAPLSVSLEVQVIGPGDAGTFHWSFGDGTPDAHQPIVVHVFDKPGTYTVKIEVASDAPAKGMDEIEVEVLPPTP